MEFGSLQVFLAIAESGSFSRAAERLYLSQPAVSKRLARLEEELGLRLFHRTGRSAHLTHAGRDLLPRARELLLRAQDMKRRASNLLDEVSGPLVFATSHHIGLRRLPEKLRHYRAAYPEVQLDIRFMDSETACRAVEKGDLELAVVTLPTDNPEHLELQELWQDELCFVVAPEHELAGRDEVSLQELLEYPAVLPGPTTYTRNILERAIQKENLEIRLGMSTNYMETLKMLTEINLGWSLLPRTMTGSEKEKLVILPVPLSLHRSLGLVTHRKRTLSNPARALVSCLP